MDPLYEHLHHEGDPIQNSGGLASNFSRLKRVGEEEIALFDVRRTTTDMSRRLRSTNKTLDPIERLPPELSTFVITQALPPQQFNRSPSMYSSRLIELTTVSKEWQRFLFSTPVLWSELVIDERQEDFLAMLSVFVRLSSNAPATLYLCNKPTGIDWTALASILLPAAERVTRLHFGLGDDSDFEWVPNALSNLLERLCRFPRLNEVIFRGVISLFRIESLRLPPTVKFDGLFQIELPESCRESGTRSRFFNVTNCKSLGMLGQLVAPLRLNWSLVKYSRNLGETKIISTGATLSQLESFAERLAKCNCFEQVVHTASFTLHCLEVLVDLSQTEDLLDCLRMLVHLHVLELWIGWGDGEITRKHTLSDMARPDLREFRLRLFGGVEHMVEAQKPLGDLFSALTILYPSVEDMYLSGSTWMSIETSYLQSLRALKSLVLYFRDSPLALPSESITLQSVQLLTMRGVARLDNLRTPNLLKLALHLGHNVTELDHLGSFPRGLRSLAISLDNDTEDFDEIEGFDLTLLDCPALRDLYLDSWTGRTLWGHPQLSNLVSITVGSILRTFINPSSTQLCIMLLCYPWRLPSLRELHFLKCVEWDVLFLMLKRRNCDASGVQMIDTVTLPFIPFAFQQLLTRLLMGEIVELPSLISLSLEATREVIFDSSVPGCFACLKNMRPGCTARAIVDEDRIMPPVDAFYPPEDPATEEVAQDIQGWLSQRWDLVKIWKTSYEEFALHFRRAGICSGFP